MIKIIKNKYLRDSAHFRAMLAILLLTAAQTSFALGIEKPEYTVIHVEDGVEYRQYEPYLVSESFATVEDGNYEAAGQTAVDRVLAYIRGDNRRVDNEAESEKMGMTLPIEQTMAADGWRVSLKVPSRYARDEVPLPNDARVTIREVPARLMAVIRHSGRWTQENFTSQMDKLTRTIEAQSVESVGDMEMAFYNPPITPPFLRRNEVMVEVRNLPEAAAERTAIRRAATE